MRKNLHSSIYMDNIMIMIWTGCVYPYMDIPIEPAKFGYLPCLDKIDSVHLL